MQTIQNEIKAELGRAALQSITLPAETRTDLVLPTVLGICAVEGDVEQEVEGSAEVLAQGGAIVDGVFLARIGIQVAANRLHAVYDVPRTAARGSLERHMLDEMGHSRLIVELMTSAGIHRYATINDLTRPSVGHDAQSII